VGLAGCGFAAVAAAVQPVGDLDQRYPKGSIVSASVAERALADAAEATRASDARYETERKRCAHVFLATQCVDTARRAHTREQVQAHGVEVEAHDLQRRVAAQERESRRDIDQARQHREDAERPEKERLAQDTAHKRENDAEQRRQEALRQQALGSSARERFEKRNADHDRDQSKRADVQIRNSGESARRYQEKQAHARSYAANRAREREENQKVRAERERERQQKALTSVGSDPLPADAKK